MRARLVPAGLLLTLNIRRVATAWEPTAPQRSSISREPGRLRPTHEVCVICKGRGVKDRYFSIWETLGDLQDEPARRPAPLVVALLLCRRRL